MFQSNEVAIPAIWAVLGRFKSTFFPPVVFLDHWLSLYYGTCDVASGTNLVVGLLSRHYPTQRGCRSRSTLHSLAHLQPRLLLPGRTTRVSQTVFEAEAK